MKFILWRDGKEHGPYDLATVESSIQSGQLSVQMLARLETGGEWKPLGQILPARPKLPRQPNPAARAKRRRVAIIVGIAILVSLGGFALSGWLKARAERAKIAAENQRKNSTLDECRKALAELKALNSVTEAGLSLAEYSRRVLDAKVRVDSLLANVPDSEPHKARVLMLLGGYLAAKELWSARPPDGAQYAMFEKSELERFRTFGAKIPADMRPNYMDGYAFSRSEQATHAGEMWGTLGAAVMAEDAAIADAYAR